MSGDTQEPTLRDDLLEAFEGALHTALLADDDHASEARKELAIYRNALRAALAREPEPRALPEAFAAIEAALPYNQNATVQAAWEALAMLRRALSAPREPEPPR